MGLECYRDQCGTASRIGLALDYYPRLASVLICVFLAIGFSAGGFEHLLSNGPDNVFRMAATEWTLPFTIRAVLLAWGNASYKDCLTNTSG
jgi:hypothetical protein